MQSKETEVVPHLGGWGWVTRNLSSSTCHRLIPALFVPLVALTAILLLLVRLPSWEYEPVQSLHLFRNLPLFVVLYILWLVLLLLLVWRTQSLLWGTALVCLFVLVHVGTIVVATPYGAAEDWLKGFDVVVTKQTGSLQPVIYGDFPASAILGAFLSDVTDVDALTLRTPLVLIWLVLLSTLLFVGYSRLFRSYPLAAMAVLLAVQSNIVVARFYWHPMYMGVLLVVALMGFLSGREQPLSTRERLVVIVFMGGLTMTHFVSSVIGFLIIAGHYVEQRWRRRPEVVSQDMVILGMTLVLSWGIYWTVTTFPVLVGFLPKVDDRFRQGIAFFNTARVSRANVEGLPLWVTAVQTFWWVAIYVAGGVLALRSLLPKHRLSAAAPGYAGAYVVVAGAAVVGTVVSPGGYDFYRILVYGSFLAAPLVLYFMLAGRRRTIVAIAVSGMFLALSFPTLLAHNTSIGQRATHPPEVAAAEFLSRELEGRENVPRLFIEDFEFWYHSPFLRDHEVRFYADLAYVGVEDYQSGWAEYVSEFLREEARGREAVFWLSLARIVHVRHILGVPTDDPMWSDTRQALSKADLFYDAGGVQLYHSTPQPLEAVEELPLPGASQRD
jgi:hypothetical protein